MRESNDFSRYYRSKHLSTLGLSVILDVLEKLGTTRSLSIAIAIRHGSITKDLLDTDPLRYFDAYSYQLDIQAVALVKKCVFIDLNVDPEEVEKKTLESWLKIEEDLMSVNKEIYLRKNFSLTSTLESARRILVNLLPPLTSIKARNTPIPKGATAFLKGLDVNIVNKLEVLDITTSAFHHYKNYYGVSTFTRGITTLMTSLGSTFEVVPKDQFKRRTIAKEPMGNMMLQLDAARALRRALGRIDINLENQQEFHGFLVRKFFNEFATIDLSDASDRISVELVRALLPDDWFRYLNDIRSKFTFLPCGKRVELEKFSPQGNGFTFELETLIFYALCRTVVPEKELVSVYGDDMIVPVSHAEKVQKVLTECGLVVNSRKSYHTGPFRESCGVDTFNGIDVRPVYLKELTKGIFGFYELANRVYEMQQNTGINLSRPLRRIIDAIEPRHRCFGPSHFGDGVLHAFELYTDTVPRKTKNCITYYRVLQRSFTKYRTRIIKRNGKWIKKRLDHAYVITCDDIKTPECQLSYALMGYPEEGVTQRNAPYFEKIIMCALS